MRSNLEMFLCALEIWGALICVLAFLFNVLFRRHRGYGVPQLVALQLACALRIVGDVVAFLLQGRSGSLAVILANVGVFVSFSLSYICFVFFVRYLCSFLHPDTFSRMITYIVYVFAGAGVLLAFSRFLGSLYYYGVAGDGNHGGRPVAPVQITTAVPFLLLTALICHNRKNFGRKKTMVFLSYIIFPAVALLLQLRGYTRISVVNIGIFLSVALMTVVLFVDQQNDIFAQREELIKKEEELVRQERKIGEMQVRLVISQIQPHFLYNALNTIYYMCDKDVEKAKSAINHFSHYLRGNMDALRKLEPVPFDVELDHVQNYLALEKMRYEDELQVEYDIEARGFSLPALSIQPLVENAVKHGVGKKDGGGTVTIRTRQMQDAFEIIVEDDGVGYDVDAEQREEERSHIGIENVRERLRDMVGGTLLIRSREGEGTVAVIDIPR